MHGRWSTQSYYVPPVSENIFRLLIIFSAAYILETLAKLGNFQTAVSAINGLALHFGPGFQPAQILTHIFLHPYDGFSGFINFLFNLIILWSFGSELERTWGSYKFLTFFYTGLLGGIILTAVLSLTLFPGLFISGFGAGLAAVMIAYAMLWPDREVLFFFIFPMKMKWLVLIIFILMAISGAERTIVQYSGGALFSALFLYYYVRKGKLYSYSYGPSTSANKAADPIQKLKQYLKKKKLQKKQEEINKRINMKEEVDRILEKISREGMDSLSKKEKKFLDEASKEF